MSVVESRLSMKSSNSSYRIQAEERTKLISLIRAWRSKHDRVFETVQRHRDVIDMLRNDLETLIEEKEKVTNDLVSQLEQERAEKKLLVEKLRAEAETARKESEIEARNLRVKLRRFREDTQPIIDLYKGRDDDLHVKINESDQIIKSLSFEKEELENKLFNLEQESEKRNERMAAENEELRINYQKKLDEMRKHCVIRLAQARHHLTSSSIIKQKKLKEEFEKESSGMQVEKQAKLKEARGYFEEESRKKIEKIKEEFNKEIHKMRLSYDVTAHDNAKKLEAVYKKTNLMKKENKHLLSVVEESAKMLQDHRIAFERNQISAMSSKETTSQVKLDRLLQELSLRMRDLNKVREDLRQEERKDLSNDINKQEKMLRLEVEYQIQMNETDRLKTLIQEKQMEIAYNKKRLSTFILSSQVEERLSTSNSADKPITSPQKQNRRVVKKSVKKQRKKLKLPDSGRDKWLFRRQDSIVQFQATTNGRQAWVDNEAKRIY